MSSESTVRSPPHAKGSYPLIGHAPRLLDEPLTALTQWGRSEEPVVEVRLPRRRFALVTAPEAVETVLVADAESYRKADIVRERLGPLQSGSLVLLEGRQWQERRGMLARAIQQPTDRTAEVTRRRATAMVEGWPTDQPVQLHEHTRECSLSILATALFGLDGADAHTPIQNAADDVLARLNVQSLAALVPDWVPTRTNRRYRRAIGQLHEELDTLIKKAEKHENEQALLGVLTSAGVDPKTIRNELIAFLFAGYDSTATALSCTLGLLADHPKIQERLRTKLPTPDQPLGSTATETGTLLDAVVRESLRLYPPQYLLFRQPDQDVTLSGFRVEADKPVVVSPWALQRNPRFFESPEQFVPDRWLESQDSAEYTYLPYGAGPRRCLGKVIANRTLRLVVAEVCRRRSLTMAGTLSVSAGPTLAVDDGLDVLAARID